MVVGFRTHGLGPIGLYVFQVVCQDPSSILKAGYIAPNSGYLDLFRVVGGSR